MNPLATPPSWLTRVGVFDLETTGVDVANDRIVTAHVGVLDIRGREVAARDWLADPGIPIPDGAAAVHGVTTEYARAHGRPPGEVIAEITHALATLFQQGLPIVAYNASYDFSLLAHEAVRHGQPVLKAPHPVIDPLVLDKAYDRFRRGKRTLSVVAEHYEVPLDAAHEASADAVAAGRVALALAKAFLLPESAAELHTQQIGWARDQAASLTEYFIKVGRLDPDESLDGSWPLRG
ncbi:DNA polymerase III subunit epsilon [Microbacterium esteraromaticum]|uniref:DNA polymerase III subunit epsilon n=2 Tax=Microbacterium esteraromaticum TaxID=57043 RepID=A0A1R4IWA1_9MICO|nr:exonuclease domain-containing protein [Microbacterium esteraromaticum]SJN24112.1 DNA polymerase III subunit epsilon [Microbacterium esteraromaticum]